MKKFLFTFGFFLLGLTPSFSADLDTIIRRGQLIVAVKNNLPPLAFLDSQGNLQGLEIDIAKRLAQELLGSENAIIFQPVSNQERLQVVIDEQVDLAIARVAITPARQRLVNFSPFYYLDSTGFVTLNPKLQRLEDLANSRIAVLNGSTTIAVVRSNLPKATLRGVGSYQEALNLLETGEVEAFAGDNSLLTGWVQEFPRYRQLSIDVGVIALGVVMPKGLQYQSFLERVNKAIARLQSSGWLAERVNYWGLPLRIREIDVKSKGE
jgi:polar amino acid transport system substrate-binding protein